MKWQFEIERRLAFAVLALPIMILGVSSAVQAQKTAMGGVRGEVRTNKGRPVGGFWLTIDNPDLGMNYRQDVNPIGQFKFTDVYPGPYVFKISPNSYTVVSPTHIDVKPGQTIEVKIVVAAVPASTGSRTPEVPTLPALDDAKPAIAAERVSGDIAPPKATLGSGN